MDEKFSAKKYFIYGFKSYITNDNKVLSKKYRPSMKELLSDYIEIYKDINNSQGNEKLSKAREELLDVTKFFIKDSVLYKQNLYKDELKVLAEQIEAKDKNSLNYTSIYNIANSLIKKLGEENIYSLIVRQVKKTKNFAEIDKLIEIFIKELLYDGYSLKYIDEWLNENILNKKLTSEIINYKLDEFKELKKEKETYIYYIGILNSEEFNDEIFINNNLKLLRQTAENIKLLDKKIEFDILRYLQCKSSSDIFKLEVKAMDLYKGLEILIDAINSYFQIIIYVRDEKKQQLIIQNKVLARNNNECNKLRMHSYDNEILFSNLAKKEKDDIKDFVKYRDRIYTSKLNKKEVFNLQRALNIISNQPKQQENRLIHLWSILEQILTFHEGLSIISKVKNIIPKLVCLYVFKDKLNIFWARLFKFKDRKIDIIDQFIEKCKKLDDEYEYDLNKLTNFILEKGENLINEFDFSDILKRDIAEIGMFLDKSQARYEYIEAKEEEIRYDLIRIYRVRNILIHSSKDLKSNLDHKTLRLYHYNKSLLGLIIYYKNKNPKLTIAEILNSINYTYQEYLKILKDDDASVEDICKLKYLFIG